MYLPYWKLKPLSIPQTLLFFLDICNIDNGPVSCIQHSKYHSLHPSGRFSPFLSQGSPSLKQPPSPFVMPVILSSKMSSQSLLPLAIYSLSLVLYTPPERWLYVWASHIVDLTQYDTPTRGRLHDFTYSMCLPTSFFTN